MLEWIQMKPRVWHHLDELFAGSCDGLTYGQIEELFPEEFELRQSDKLAYRYPRGESYLDVIARLEPIIIEMERHREPLLIGMCSMIYFSWTKCIEILNTNTFLSWPSRNSSNNLRVLHGFEPLRGPVCLHPFKYSLRNATDGVLLRCHHSHSLLTSESSRSRRTGGALCSRPTVSLAC